MKIVVAVIVYDRKTNLQRWLDCWRKCEQRNAELVIIKNYDEKSPAIDERFINAKVINRKNVGYDIGAMQDVFAKRLIGFPDWDYLLWCTDDVIPMTKDFITPFIKTIKPGVGIAAMQISKEDVIHVRTTGFMITKEVSEKINFPAEPVTTMNQCHIFEHSQSIFNFTRQIRQMGLSCDQVAPLIKSPLYDMNWPVRNKKVAQYKEKYNRMKEHQMVYGI